MKNQRLWALLILLTLAPAMTSCWPFRKKKPVAPAPLPPPQQQQTAPPKPIQFPPPPAIEPSPSKSPIPEEPQEQLPPPPVKKRPSPAGPRVSPAPAPQEPEVEPVPETPPAPTPSLQPILSPEQKQELETAVRTRITSARLSLASIQRRSLTQEQKAAVNQIRVFIEQAEEARKTDLIRASNLAERADVLARDLVAGIR